MAYSDIAIVPEDTLGADSQPDDLYRVGLAYAVGVDVEVDIVAAHKWFNLAASRGHEEARTQRSEMADMMSSDDLTIALQAAREWLKLMN
jgi:TPR repeat protein